MDLGLRWVERKGGKECVKLTGGTYKTNKDMKPVKILWMHLRHLCSTWGAT